MNEHPYWGQFLPPLKSIEQLIREAAEHERKQMSDRKTLHIVDGSGSMVRREEHIKAALDAHGAYSWVLITRSGSYWNQVTSPNMGGSPIEAAKELVNIYYPKHSVYYYTDNDRREEHRDPDRIPESWTVVNVDNYTNYVREENSMSYSPRTENDRNYDRKAIIERAEEVLEQRKEEQTEFRKSKVKFLKDLAKRVENEDDDINVDEAYREWYLEASPKGGGVTVAPTIDRIQRLIENLKLVADDTIQLNGVERRLLDL